MHHHLHPLVGDHFVMHSSYGRGKSAFAHPCWTQSKSIRWGKMDILYTRSHMSVRANGGSLTDRGRNGVEDKEV
jgi:hypothetical protein